MIFKEIELIKVVKTMPKPKWHEHYNITSHIYIFRLFEIIFCIPVRIQNLFICKNSNKT